MRSRAFFCIIVVTFVLAAAPRSAKADTWIAGMITHDEDMTPNSYGLTDFHPISQNNTRGLGGYAVGDLENWDWESSVEMKYKTTRGYVKDGNPSSQSIPVGYSYVAGVNTRANGLAAEAFAAAHAQVIYGSAWGPGAPTKEGYKDQYAEAPNEDPAEELDESGSGAYVSYVLDPEADLHYLSVLTKINLFGYTDTWYYIDTANASAIGNATVTFPDP